MSSSETTTTNKAAPWPRRLIYLLWPLPVAWLSLNLMAAYLRHYDIGINPSATSGFLAWVVAPMLLTGLYACAWLAWALARRMLGSSGSAMGVGGLVVAAAGALALVMFTRQYSSYPTEHPQDLVAFLGHWLRPSR